MYVVLYEYFVGISNINFYLFVCLLPQFKFGSVGIFSGVDFKHVFAGLFDEHLLGGECSVIYLHFQVKNSQ